MVGQGEMKIIECVYDFILFEKLGNRAIWLEKRRDKSSCIHHIALLWLFYSMQ